MCDRDAVIKMATQNNLTEAVVGIGAGLVAASIALIGFGVDSIIESLSGLCLLESFPFFAVLVLVAHVTHHHSLLTLWGAHLYFWARLGYVLAAATGYGLLRSILFWNAAFAGMVLFLVALLA